MHVADAVLSAPARLGAVRLVAIDGPSGAGKSTFAKQLRGEFDRRGVVTTSISTDHFATWENPVAWWPELVEGVLLPVARHRPGQYRKMDWSDGVPSPGELITVAPPEVLILEGMSSGRASIRPRLSMLCWVEIAEAKTRLERAVARDGEASRRHLEAWQDFERGWFTVDRTRQHVHPNGLIATGQFGQ